MENKWEQCGKENNTQQISEQTQQRNY